MLIIFLGTVWNVSYVPQIMAYLFAQTSGGGSGSPIPWGDILKFGITPVIVLILLISRVLRVGTEVDKSFDAFKEQAAQLLATEKDRADRAEKRAEAAEERERRLRDATEERVLPLINTAQSTMQRVLDYLLTRPGGRS